LNLKEVKIAIKLKEVDQCNFLELFIAKKLILSSDPANNLKTLSLLYSSLWLEMLKKFLSTIFHQVIYDMKEINAIQIVLEFNYLAQVHGPLFFTIFRFK
jgi:hypothetical protein